MTLLDDPGVTRSNTGSGTCADLLGCERDSNDEAGEGDGNESELTVSNVQSQGWCTDLHVGVC